MDNLNPVEKKALSILEKGIPVTERPFRDIANMAGIKEVELIDMMEKLLEKGIIKRLGAKIAFYKTGCRYNALVAWNVPREQVDEVGNILAKSDFVSHCYLRRPFPGFKYNIYSMIHCTNLENLKNTILELSGACGIDDYIVLRTLNEFKKTSPVIFSSKGE